MPSAAEYLASMHQGGDTWVRVNRAFKENLLDKSSAYNFALAQDLTTDTAGLLEQRLLGPVIQDLSFMRPVVTALGVTAMPATPAKTFTKTKISQHTSVGTQTEGSAVTSQKMTLSANTVTKATQAGGVFNGLVCGAVFAQTNGVVCEHMDHTLLHERGHANGVA